MAGNRGKISNLVHVRVSSPTSVYMNPKRNLKEPVLKLASKSVDPDWIIIGSICGVISVLLVMAISSITYYIYVSRKRSMATGSTSSVMGGAVSDETDASSFDSDIKNIMSNPLGTTQTLNSVSSYQVTPTDTNSTNVTPVYWSASQLLSKIDQKNYNSQPQSLQLEHQNYSLHQHQPVSLHYNSSWNYPR